MRSSWKPQRFVLPLIVALSLNTFALADETAIECRFESATDNWKARATSITVSHRKGRGAEPNSEGYLGISGAIDSGWNYVGTDRYLIQPGELYRLSCWLRVDKLGSTTPAPYLKIEFIGSDVKSHLARVHTPHYDTAKLGTWQRLVQEFKAPDEARGVWFALEKGVDQPTEIAALLDEFRLERISQLTILEQYRLKPMPAALQRLQGVHPRLFLDAALVAHLQQAIGGSHAQLWQEVKQNADNAVRRGPPSYRAEPDSSGLEQLWQRGVGNAMPTLALAYLLTGEQQYLNSARQWALASCSYKTWGLGRYDGMDLATGHQLFGLAIVYDWCYDDLDEPTRRTVRDTLIRQGGALFEAAATGRTGWHRAYLQNHLWVNACGLAVAGLALFDEVEDAELWVGLALEKFRRTTAALGPDGASHEGVGYWEYGVEYLLKFMHLARANLGVDLYDNDWWRQTAAYPLYLALPRNAWTRDNCTVDLADSPRRHWYGPDYLLRKLASEYHNPHAQWLAQQTDQAGVTSSGAIWLNLLWYDPSVVAAPPTDLPTLRHFSDIDIVSARSDWSGDESLVVLKCGPFLGHKAVEEFSSDPGGGHVHPDANHFVIFGNGEWLIRDDGYRVKWTCQHNTLLIDGRGQLGEGRMWFQGSQPLAVKARPRIVRTSSSRSLDYMLGDATQAYPAALGLQSYRRHLLFLKPSILIVADDIHVDEPRDLELRFFPESDRVVRDKDAFLFQGKKARLRLEPLTTESTLIAAEDVAVEGRHGGKRDRMFAVRMRRKTDVWRSAVAFSWCAAHQLPPVVTMETTGQRWTFHAGHRSVTLDWSTGAIIAPLD